MCGGMPTVCGLAGSPGAQAGAFTVAQVGLGKNAAKALFPPEECVCSGLSGLPKNGRQRVNSIGLVRNRNNSPFTQTLQQTQLGLLVVPLAWTQGSSSDLSSFWANLE